MDILEFYLYTLRRLTRSPLALVFVICGAAFPFVLTIFNRYGIATIGGLNIRTTYLSLLGIMLVGFVFQWFLWYLERGPSQSIRRSLDSHSDSELYLLRRKLDELVKETKKATTVTFEAPQIDKNELLETLKTSITDKLSKGAFASIDEEFAKRDLQSREWERLITGFEKIRERLYGEYDNLRRRSNLNLALGSLTTVIAGVGLVVVVFLKPLDLTGLDQDAYGWKVMAHYIPRLSLIIFAEVFAYFFLRLYKAGLSDMKFYQNEMTNVEIKLAALKAALAGQDKETIRFVICQLSKTERNFILRKGETTVELEKFKADGFDGKDVIESIAAAVKAK